MCISGEREARARADVKHTRLLAVLASELAASRQRDSVEQHEIGEAVAVRVGETWTNISFLLSISR